VKLVNVPSLLDQVHEERTPSWQMRDDDQDPDRHGRWRCLGACHTGGGPIGLAMRLLGLDAQAAWEWIKTGSTVDRVPIAIEIASEAPDLSRFIHGFHLPLGVEFAPLFEWPRPAAAYLERRGVTAEQVDRWGLGFATGGKLAHRIVMPWRDGMTGKLLGYTARTYLRMAKRYREPGEEEQAARGAVYGEEHWPPVAARDAVVVIEGGFDGFAIERATGMAFGAACGSQLLPAHASKLSTFKTVVIATGTFDEAAQKFHDTIIGMLARWTRVVPVELPTGPGAGRYDPARIEAELGPRVLAEAVRNALPS
jgi:hypothetical protein